MLLHGQCRVSSVTSDRTWKTALMLRLLGTPSSRPSSHAGRGLSRRLESLSECLKGHTPPDIVLVITEANREAGDVQAQCRLACRSYAAQPHGCRPAVRLSSSAWHACKLISPQVGTLGGIQLGSDQRANSLALF